MIFTFIVLEVLFDILVMRKQEIIALFPIKQKTITPERGNEMATNSGRGRGRDGGGGMQVKNGDAG